MILPEKLNLFVPLTEITRADNGKQSKQYKLYQKLRDFFSTTQLHKNFNFVLQSTLSTNSCS